MTYHLRVASIFFLLSIAGCTSFQLPPVPPDILMAQAGQLPLSCVDVLVITRPGFEEKKLLGFIPKFNSASRTWGISEKVQWMMSNLADALRLELGEAGAAGVVGTDSKGYHPSACRTHLVTAIPTGATSGGIGGVTVEVQVTFYEAKDKRKLWQSNATISERNAGDRLRQSLMAALRSLGMKVVPKAPVLLMIPGLPVNIGDSMATAQMTLGTSQEPEPVESAVPSRKYASLKLPERGVNLIFNEESKLVRIKLMAPYSEAVRGVRIGDSRDAVLRTLGEPTSDSTLTEIQPSLRYRTSTDTLVLDFESKGTVKAIWIQK